MKKAILTAIILGLAPRVPALGVNENLFVGNWANGNILRINSAGVSTVFNSTTEPMGLAFDASGALFVADDHTATIQKLNSAGVATTFATGLNGAGLAFDTVGNLYVANGIGHNIMKFNSAGVATTFASFSRDFVPFGMTFDKAGNLYVNGLTSTILKIDPAGNSTVFSTQVANPRGMAFDQAGNLYVADYYNNTIDKIDQTGAATIFAHTGLNLPLSLAIDSTGNLYAGNFGNGTIEKIDSTGTGTLFADFGINQPFALAVQTVPEPAVWAVLMLGFGSVKVVRWRVSSCKAPTSKNWRGKASNDRHLQDHGKNCKSEI